MSNEAGQSVKSKNSEPVWTPQLKISRLPSEWKWAQLGDVCKTTSGGTPSRKFEAYFCGDIPWVKSGELPDGPVAEIEECITDEALKSSSAKLFPAGTLLIALYGATVGKLGVLTRDAATNQAVCAIFPPEFINTKYLFWYLRFVRSDLVAKAIGGAQPNISQSILRTIPIPIAPLEQQKQIVAEIEKQFSRLDEAVANLKRVKANLKRYKAAVLKAAVEGKLTEEWRKAHPDVEPASELLKRILAERRAKWNGKGKYKEPAPPDTRGLPLLPVRWTWASADQLSLKITDGEHLSPKTLEVGVPLLSAKDVRENGVIFGEAKYVAREDADKFRNRCDPAQGDILIVSRGATIGRTCRVDTGVVFCLMGSVILIKPLSFLDTGFLLTALKSTSSHRLLRGISGSTAQQAIYIRDIRSIPIPLPPLEEQTEVFSVIEADISNANSVDVSRNKAATKSSAQY